MISILKMIFGFLTLKSWRNRRKALSRRLKYEFLRSQIIKRHLAGLNGLVVDFKDHKFDWTDMLCFRPPMYQLVQNKDMKWCIFWDKKKMTEEAGSGPVLTIVKPQTEPIPN